MIIKLKTFFLLYILILTISTTFGQGYNAKIERQVLRKGIIDSVFIFGTWTENSQTEKRLAYLGEVTTRSGRTFRVMNSIWIWGQSPRATSNIFIFNLKNQYVGQYNVNHIDHLPASLRKGKLIFTNQGSGCDKNLKTIINLKKGLPKQFFRKCSEELRDIYTFESI